MRVDLPGGLILVGRVFHPVQGRSLNALAARSQQCFQFGPVEPYHYLAVHQRDRSGHVAKLFQFTKGRLIGGDIPLGELNLLLGKKLFHAVAEQSSRLAVDDDFLAHGTPPQPFVTGYLFLGLGS